MSTPRPDPASTRSLWRAALTWGERGLTLALLVFVALRLRPQIGALTGLAPGGAPAPAYTLVTLDGDTIRSADLAGKVVVVNFWASWCIPCRLEMPSLEKLHERHARGDLVVLGFDTDAGNDAAVRAFVAAHGVTYSVGRAGDEERVAFGGIRAVPTTFIVDREGIVRHEVVGYFAPPALEAAVSRLLREDR